MKLSRYNSLSRFQMKWFYYTNFILSYKPKYKLKSWKLRFGISDRIRDTLAFSEFDSQIIWHISSLNAFVWKVAFINLPSRFKFYVVVHKRYKPLCTIYRTDAFWVDWCSASVSKRNNICNRSRVPFISLSTALLHIPKNRLEINNIENFVGKIRIYSYLSWYIIERKGWSTKNSIWFISLANNSFK
jgi:hypothetical protein